MTKEEVEVDRQGQGDDLKESLEIGREGVDGMPNLWPEERDEDGLVGFRETMVDFFERCRQLHVVVMRGIALGMGLPPDFFNPFMTVGEHTLRLLHYPAVSADAFQGWKSMRAGAHTDFGDLTFLFQDDRGGLQVEKPGSPGHFIDVVPVEGAIVVNSGDLLARWSNDLIRSTMHRVVQPPRSQPPEPLDKTNGTSNADATGGEGKGEVSKYPARYSVAYFCNPDFDAWIEALPGTWGGEKGGKKYEGVNSGAYLTQRLEATY
jgi:isopenicillin N synthase-like dioxygenase